MPIYAPTGFLDVTNATLRGSKIVTTSNVGVANVNPLNTLSVGSNLQVEDTGSNVLTVLGNAAAAAMTLGVITLAPSYSLEIVSNIGNTVSNTVQFTNETTGFVSESNIEVGTGNLFVNTSTGLVSVGNALSVSGRADLTDLHASNLTVDGALYANASTGRVGINTTSPGDFNVDIHGSANVGALTATDVTVTGNLTVAGELTSIRSTTVNVDDPIIGLANNNTSDPAVLDIGFVMARPSTATGSNVAIIFDESSDTLEIGYTTGKHTDTTITIDDSALFHTNIHGNVAVSNLEVGQFSVVAAYGLDHVTNENNSTGDTIISTNGTTGLQTTANVSVGRDALVSGNVEVSKELTVSGNTVVSQELSVSGNTVVSQELTVSGNTVVSQELTVSGNVEVSKELTVSGNTVVSQELTVSGNVEVGTANLFVDTTTGNVGVGVAHPTSRFEVAGTETLQEYPPKAMTGYETYMEGHGVFKASASSTWSTNEYEAFGAFNKTLLAGTPDLTWNSVAGGFSSGSDYAYTGTNSLGGISGEWLKLSTPYAINPSTIKITVASSYINNYAPEDFYLLGSVDDATWYVLAQETGETWSSLSHTSSINTTNTYKYFALVVTKTRGADNTNVTEMQVFGTPAPSSLEDGHLTLGKALTLPRVSGHAAGAETPRAESLVVHYDTTVDSVVSGSTVVDVSGNGINSAMQNGLVYSSSSRALDFAAANARTYISAGPNSSAGAWVHSVSFWFYTTQSSGTMFFIGDRTTNKSVGVNFQPNNVLRYYFWGNDIDSPTNAISLNTWTHGAFTYDGSTTKKMYINGELVNTTGTQAALNLSAANEEFSLGSQVNGADVFNGKISNLKVWGGVTLTADEVAMEYALGRTGKSLNLTDTSLCLGGTVPRAQLDVRGSARFDGFVGIDGDVGIGTTSPQTPLEVRQPGGYFKSMYIQKYLGSGPEQATSYVLLLKSVSGNPKRFSGKISGVRGYSGNNNTFEAEIIAGVGSGAGLSGRMTFTYSSNSNNFYAKLVSLTYNSSTYIALALIPTANYNGMSGGIYFNGKTSAIGELQYITDLNTLSSIVDFPVSDGDKTTFTGNVGIGVTNPVAALDFGSTVRNRIINLWGSDTGGDSSTNFYGFGVNSSILRYNVPDSGRTHRFYGGGTEFGYVNNGTGFVNSFTGQHKSFPDESLFGKTSDDLCGLIVSASGEYISINDKVPQKGQGAIQVSEAIPTVKLSTSEKDKKVFGVVSDVEDVETSQRHDRYGAFVSTFEKEPGDSRIYVNSIGEGAMWVVNTAGPLESGDYITTSNVAGYGQRQESEFLANYTVAKITMDCDFNPPNIPVQRILKELSNVNYWVKTTYSNVSLEEYSNLAEENRTTTTETVYTNEDHEITTDKYNTLESNVQSTYTELTRIIHQKMSTEEYKTEQEGTTLEVRQELVNVLDEHGQLQWEDTDETEKAYKIRYLDASGQQTDEANAVHIAAFVGCTYHCG
jgi:hypothetical protein